jgi:hypothetical protein
MMVSENTYWKEQTAIGLLRAPAREKCWRILYMYFIVRQTGRDAEKANKCNRMRMSIPVTVPMCGRTEPVCGLELIQRANARPSVVNEC